MDSKLMFESLRAAKAAQLTLTNMKGPGTRAQHRAWSCTLLFFGAIVGSASGSDRKNEFILVLNKGVQDQIIENLKKHGFELDFTNIPSNSIGPSTPSNYMRLAIAQIADEMDIVREIRAAATSQTLVVFAAAPGKVEVYPYKFTPDVKANLQKAYGEKTFEILNESILGL